MTWLNEPRIELDEQAGTLVIRIQGDLILDMPNDWRQAVIDGLGVHSERDRVVVDLTSVNRVGSWGEKRIKSFVGAVVGGGGRVAVVIDPHRSAMFAGLQVELSGVEPPIPIADDVERALAGLDVGQ